MRGSHPTRTEDVLSDSFCRFNREVIFKNDELMLNDEEVIEFRKTITKMISKHYYDFEIKFISDSPQSLLSRVQYFEALLGRNSFPNNACNAPNVSAVITSTGEIQPCFFLPLFETVKKQPLYRTLNNKQIRATRNDVCNRKIERCTTCVCTLHVSPVTALMDIF